MWRLPRGQESIGMTVTTGGKKMDPEDPALLNMNYLVTFPNAGLEIK